MNIQLTTSEICDMCCAILRNTNDGDNLSPDHLYLTECAINGFLTTNGMKAFVGLHKTVTDGNYTKPYHLGVEFMTKDHEGYIYFKGKHVEHYSHPDWESEKKDLIELQRICLLLESKGIEVNSMSTVWRVEEFLTAEEINVAIVKA